MIKVIESDILHPTLRELLCYATSASKVERVYSDYQNCSYQQLFGLYNNEDLVGCIGIDIERVPYVCIIKHIAVSQVERGNRLGTTMINYIMNNIQSNMFTAETDKDAVDFYRKLGFSVTSLGEKYPGVERFHCEYSK